MTSGPAAPESPGTRSDLLRRGGLAAAGGLTGAAALAHAGGVGAQSAAQERQVLNLLLLVERTEAAFYEKALSEASLTGEMREFAQVVLEHERAHVQALEQALGPAADEEPTFDFGDATGSPQAFADAAAGLEDVAVAAYNGQAGNVGPDAFLVAARIVSVEARHAAWIRSIVDRDPAPDAVDQPQTAEEVRTALERIGVTA
jgi:Ferritin-like domain